MNGDAANRTAVFFLSVWSLLASTVAVASPFPGETQPSGTLEDAQRLVQEGHYAQAEALSRGILRGREDTHGPDTLESAEAMDVLVEAIVKGGKAREPESHALAVRAVTIKEKRHGPDHLDVAASLKNLALLLQAMGSYAEAKSLAERGLAIREKQLGPEHPAVAETLNGLGAIFRDMGLFTEAKTRLERALEIREKQLGLEHRAVAETLSMLGEVFWELGLLTEAKPRLERAIAIQEKELGAEHPDLAQSLNLKALVLGNMGEYIEARSLHERALAIRERQLGRDHPAVAESLFNLAAHFHGMGSYAEAKGLFERALEIREKRLGPDHPEVATSLNGLAVLLRPMASYAEAKQLYERALDIYVQRLGPEHPRVAITLSNLGLLLRHMGSHTEAKPLLERALTIREKQLGHEHPEVAMSLNNLGALLEDMGSYTEAKSLFERALTISEKGLRQRGAARSLNKLAALLQHMGSYVEAKPLIERALAIREKQLGAEHPEVADSLNNLADLLRLMGSYAEAKPMYERALFIRENQLGPDHPHVAMTLNNLAILQVLTGERRDALRSALRVEEIGRMHLQFTARLLAEPQALGYAAVRASGLDLLLGLAAETPDTLAVAPRSAWDALVRSRALVLDEIASRHHKILRATDPETGDLYQRYVLASQRLANLNVRGPRQDPSERYRSWLDDARRQKEQAEEQLAERSQALRQELVRGKMGLDEVAANLPRESALVAYAIYRALPAPEQTGKILYLAFVLRQGEKDPAVVPLGEAVGIEDLVTRWKEQVRRPPGAGGESAYRKAGEDLRRKVWDPLFPHFGNVGHVFIVPDGALNLVSFAALPMGKDQYLVETGPILHYLSSERDLVPQEGTVPEEKGLLALGGAAFDETSLFAALSPSRRKKSVLTAVASAETTAITVSTALGPHRSPRSNCKDFRSIQFDPLPAAPYEVKEIAGLWQKHASGGAEVLTGALASEAAFKLKAGGHRILHLATHGFFLGDCPSALEATRGVGGLAEARDDRLPPPMEGENPLVLSGLALAGANHRAAAKPDEDDGILTAEEIAALDLSGVEWAVLSACDTGRGEIRTGEGVFGLRRAFQVAGARTLIMSLWAVGDHPTRRWMRALYAGRLQKGLSTPDAVRSASLEVLQEQRKKRESTHPFSWAAFVAAGDWR